MKRLADDATMRKEPGWKAQARATAWPTLSQSQSQSQSQSPNPNPNPSPNPSLTRRRAARTARRASPLPPTLGRRAAVRLHVEMHGGCGTCTCTCTCCGMEARHGGCLGLPRVVGGAGWVGERGLARPLRQSLAQQRGRQATQADPSRQDPPVLVSRRRAAEPQLSALCSHRASSPPQAADAKSADGHGRRGGFSRVARGEPRPRVAMTGGGGGGRPEIS